MRFLARRCILLVPLLCLPTAGRPALAVSSGSAAQAEARVPEEMVAGVFINGRLAAEEAIYRFRGHYWIRFSLFLDEVGLSLPEPAPPVFSWSTTLGVVSFEAGRLLAIEGERFISLSDIDNAFAVRTAFDPLAYAIRLEVPWSPARGEQRRVEPPDVAAPDNSLSFVGLELRMAEQFGSDSARRFGMSAAGSLLGGIWDVSGFGDGQQRVEAESYHWTFVGERMALRLGTGVSGVPALLARRHFTGIQLGWDNHSMPRRLDGATLLSSDRFLSEQGDQFRSIEGSGPPAGIAELRFDGKVAARVRIALDGGFVFENVRMSADLRRTEVYLYQRSLQDRPTGILDYSQLVSSRAMPESELLLQGGIGSSGNLLDGNREQPGALELFSSLRYGATDRLTIEGAVQANPDSGHGEGAAGCIFALDAHWIGALHLAESNRSHALEGRLEALYEGVRVAWWGSRRGNGFGGDGRVAAEQHLLRASVWPNSPLTLLALGNYELLGGSVEQRSLLPGARWQPAGWLALSAMPDQEGRYRHDCLLRLSPGTTLRSTYEEPLLSFDLQQRIDDGLSLRLLHDRSLVGGGELSILSADWYPHPGAGRDLLQGSIAAAGGRVGFEASWSRYADTGLRFSLRYRNQMSGMERAVPELPLALGPATPSRHQLDLVVSWEFGVAGYGPVPAGRRTLGLTRGGIAGRIELEEGGAFERSAIDALAISLNGQTVVPDESGGRFVLGHLPPGTYTLALDPEHLPIELSATSSSLQVEVAEGRLTTVRLPLQARYGIAGKVAAPSGELLEGVELRLYDGEGRLAGQAVTDRFGRYRIDNLPDGSYRLQAAGREGLSPDDEQSLPVAVKGDYRFDIDLLLPRSAAQSP